MRLMAGSGADGADDGDAVDDCTTSMPVVLVSPVLVSPVLVLPVLVLPADAVFVVMCRETT